MKKLLIIILLLFSVSVSAQSLETSWKKLLNLSNTWDSTQRFGHVIIDSSLTVKDAFIDGFVYLAGNESTDGSWRFSASLSGDMIFEYRLSGVWTEKSRITK